MEKGEGAYLRQRRHGRQRTASRPVRLQPAAAAAAAAAQPRRVQAGGDGGVVRGRARAVSAGRSRRRGLGQHWAA